MRVLEAADTVGGGARSAELTLPGFVHDVCSAIHPLGVASPFFRTLPLAEHGVEWIEPPAALAHPFDDGTAALLERSPEASRRGLGEDEARWRRLFAPLVRDAEPLLEDVLAPLHVPAHPLALARFGVRAAPAGDDARPALVSRREGTRPLRGPRRALDAAARSRRRPRPSASCSGCSATRSAGRSPRGGSQRLSDALASYLRSLGGEIETGRRVESLAELGDARTVLLDVTPRGLLALAGDRLPDRYRRGLERYRYGPGVFKLDWALDGPIPWRAEECARAATVHLGGTLEEIAASEAAPWRRARSRSGRTCSSPSRASSTRRARRPGSTPPGRTATSRTARPST